MRQVLSQLHAGLVAQVASDAGRGRGPASKWQAARPERNEVQCSSSQEYQLGRKAPGSLRGNAGWQQWHAMPYMAFKLC